MKSFKKFKMVLGFVGLFIFLSTSLASAEVFDKSEQWKSFLSIYGWATGVTGDVKFKGLDLKWTRLCRLFDNPKFFHRPL